MPYDPGYDLGAFDLDGTLLRRDLVVTKRTTEALGRLRKLGMRLVVATGRRYESAREQAGRLGFDGDEPVICYGGAMIRTMFGDTLIHHTLPPEAGAEVLEWAAERNLHARVFLDGRTVVSPHTAPSRLYLRRPEEPDVSVVGLREMPAWLRESGERPTRIVLVDQPEAVDRWLDKAREAFRDKLFVTRSLPHYVEVGSPESTKSRALAFLCERWRVDPARTIAFGDADNDIDMLRFAGHGVVVGGINAAVREAGDAVAPPVDEDGVSRYVEELLGGA